MLICLKYLDQPAVNREQSNGCDDKVLQNLSTVPVLFLQRASRGPQVTKLLEQGPSTPLKDFETSPDPGEGSATHSQYLEVGSR